MPNLTEDGNRLVQNLASRHGLSTDAVTHMLIAVYNGNGTMAQFGHPEFGGSGQWMRGGMTMVSDLFNNQLKYRVDSLCSDISNSLSSHLFLPDPTYNWWPTEFGAPAATGAQNSVRYAYFPSARRLAVTTGGDVWVYDTLDHQIGGFSQQQGMGGSITFTSQFGTVNLSTLPVISRGGVAQQTNSPATNSFVTQPSLVFDQPTAQTNNSGSIAPSPSTETATDHNSILETLERLGALKEKGYISEEEFATKKSELLSRL